MKSKVLKPPIQLCTKAEVEAHMYREALIALECGYDLENVLSMSRLSQETYWLLKGDNANRAINGSSDQND